MFRVCVAQYLVDGNDELADMMGGGVDTYPINIGI